MENQIFEIGAGGLKPVSAEGKNDLEVGRVLYFNGYGDDDYVIVKRLDIDNKYGYGRSYIAINKRSKSEGRFQAFELKWLNEKKDNRIAVYITDDVVSPDEVLELREAAQAKKLVDAAEQQKKEDARKAGLANLPSIYPKLIQRKDSKLSSAALGSKNLKKELDEKWPGVKFSVKSQYYSGGCSIYVEWQDGPSVDEVKKISGKYEEGSFDGSIDLYEYNDSIFPDVFGGAKYVREQRGISAERYEEVAKEYGWESSRDQYGVVRFADREKEDFVRREVWKRSYPSGGAK